MNNINAGDVSGQSSSTADILLEQLMEQVEARRGLSGLSYSDMAKRMGVSRAYISKIMSGRQNLTLGTLVKLAESLDCGINLSLSVDVVNTKVIIRRF